MKNGRCRIHGGKSPGAPLENQRAFKHGYFSREAIEQRRELRTSLQAMKAMLADLRQSPYGAAI